MSLTAEEKHAQESIDYVWCSDSAHEFKKNDHAFSLQIGLIIPSIAMKKHQNIDEYEMCTVSAILSEKTGLEAQQKQGEVSKVRMVCTLGEKDGFGTYRT